MSQLIGRRSGVWPCSSTTSLTFGRHCKSPFPPPPFSPLKGKKGEQEKIISANLVSHHLLSGSGSTPLRPTTKIKSVDGLRCVTPTPQAAFASLGKPSLRWRLILEIELRRVIGFTWWRSFVEIIMRRPPIFSGWSLPLEFETSRQQLALNHQQAMFPLAARLTPFWVPAWVGGMLCSAPHSRNGQACGSV